MGTCGCIGIGITDNQWIKDSDTIKVMNLTTRR